MPGPSSIGSPPVGEAKPLWLELAIEEYNAMRGEILTTMATQDGTLRFATATVGIVLAAGFNLWAKDSPAATLVFLGVVPALCAMGLIVWLGEVARMMRASDHLFRLEELFACKLGPPEPVMRWETKLRDSSDGTPQWQGRYVWNYQAIVLTFWFLGVGSVGAGVYRAQGETRVWIAGAVILLAMALGLVLIRKVLKDICNDEERAACAQRARGTSRRSRARSAGR